MSSRWIYMVVVLLLTLSACKNKNAENKETTYKIGVVIPLSGELASYGESTRRGVLLAAEEINNQKGYLNKKLEVIFEDSKGETKTGISNLNKMISVQNINYFIGDVSSTVTLGMIPVVDKNEVFLFSTCAATPKLSNISPLFVRNWPSNSIEGKTAADFLINKGISSVSIVYVNNDWGLGLQDAFKNEFTKSGKIIENEIYPYGNLDFKTIIARLKSSKSEYIYLAGNQKEMGHFTRQLREANSNLKIIANTSYLESDCLNISGEYSDGVIVPTPSYSPSQIDNKQANKFYMSFKEQYPNLEPGLTDANSYDAIMLMAKALINGHQEPIKMSSYIRNYKNYNGAAGKVSFINGDIERGTIFKVVMNGKAEKYEE